jgi:hypothetical protein
MKTIQKNDYKRTKLSLLKGIDHLVYLHHMYLEQHEHFKNELKTNASEDIVADFEDLQKKIELTFGDYIHLIMEISKSKKWAKNERF